MANKEELAARLASQMAEFFSEEVYGPEGQNLTVTWTSSKTSRC